MKAHFTIGSESDEVVNRKPEQYNAKKNAAFSTHI